MRCEGAHVHTCSSRRPEVGRVLIDRRPNALVERQLGQHARDVEHELAMLRPVTQWADEAQQGRGQVARQHLAVARLLPHTYIVAVRHRGSRDMGGRGV